MLFRSIIFRTIESNPLMIFPNEADSYHITQIALYTRACNDTLTFTIDIPRIGNIIKNDRVITCDQRLPYMWRGRALTVDGQYQDIVHMSNGCDSIFNLDFKVESTIQTIIDSTICQGQTVIFEGEVKSASGTYSKTYSTSVGCDSTVTLNFTVMPAEPTPSRSSIGLGAGYERSRRGGGALGSRHRAVPAVSAR